MLIYTVMFYCYADTELMLATTERTEALELFKSCSDFSLQVWDKGEVITDIWNHYGDYESNGGLERYPENGQQLFNEIVEQLQ
ncbi:hypothetical protein CN544_28580 [Bacillus toyonensis]|uniref:hypothetical protein n=1 Tax=Bacillus toyonensis TaxID=155322 RepID=UPI000BEF1BE0|nr:hypothetical protein [Bacillus toyonensis]PEN76809.1 hypothetical protein CN544_28580 [Bacillus toyonensis]